MEYYNNMLYIKFRYNARSDWLKERALSEYRARNGQLKNASAFWLIWHQLNVLYGSDKRKE